MESTKTVKRPASLAAIQKKVEACQKEILDIRAWQARMWASAKKSLAKYDRTGHF